jgi:hypothetical protein
MTYHAYQERQTSLRPSVVKSDAVTHLNNSRPPGGQHPSGESNSRFIKPVVSPALLMWMRGSRGWYAFEVSEASIVGMSEIRRWKIAALVVPIFFAGIAFAGTLQTRIGSGAAVESKNTHEYYDSKRHQITAWSLPIGGASGAAVVSKISHAFYNSFYDRRRRQFTGALLSIGITSGADSYDRKQRQITEWSLPFGGASGAAMESKTTHALYAHFHDRKRRQLTGVLLSIGSTSGAVVEFGDIPDAYDRKRRQITSMRSDSRGSTHVVEAQPALRVWPTLPPHGILLQESRRSIGHSHAANNQNPKTNSSGTVREILTSSLNELQTITQGEVNASKSESIEKQASITPSIIPKPVRKLRKPIKSVKTKPAKTSSKKASGPCSNRIWRCR